MSAGPPLLEVQGLYTSFNIEGKKAWAVRDVTFTVHEGEVVGIVGESGSGKSVTALSILRLIPSPPGLIEKGSVRFKGRDLLPLSWPEMHKVRGKDIAMIFQEPMTSLNPVYPIGFQVAETLQVHEKVDKKQARDRAAEMLQLVGIPDPVRRLDDYPHQFSGGMRQRVMIAMALVCNPALLIADEPTTALDVTIQAQILDLMMDLEATRPGASILLITHDLAVVAETCDKVVVMYGSAIQEVATSTELFDTPLHPYTQGLMASMPGKSKKGERLKAIPGNVPGILDFPPGCRFCNRCERAVARCRIEEPELREVAPGHLVRCHLVEV